MWILISYIARTIIMSTLMVFAVFLLLNIVFGYIAELDNLKKGYDAYTAFLHVVFKSPYFMVKIFPISLLIGTVFALGKLSDQSELTVIRASGISLQRLLLIVLSIGMGMVLLSMVITEWIVPKSERYAQNLVNTSLNKSTFQKTRYGVWLLQDGKFFHIRKMKGLRSMQNMTLFDYDGIRLKQIKKIRKAHLGDKGDWLFKGVVDINFSDMKINKVRHKKEVMKSAVSPEVLAQMQVKTDKLSTLELLEQNDFLRANGLSTEATQLVLWKRVAYPISTLLMLFLAFPFILKSSRSVSLSQKVLFGVLFGVFFFVLNLIAEQFGLIYDVPIWLPIFAPTLLFFLVGLWQYRKI